MLCSPAYVRSRSALEMIPESEPLCAAVHGNLGALLLEAFRPAEALEEIDKAIALVSAVEVGDWGRHSKGWGIAVGGGTEG